MPISTRYYATQGRNGTEDEIAIHAPDGREIAFIWFWDEPEEVAKPIANQKKADAKLIVDALNAFVARAAAA